MYQKEINRAVYGFRQYGDIRYREAYTTTYTFPLLDAGNRQYKIIVYNRSDLKLFEMGSDVQKNIIGDIRFELLEIGCGSFKFTLLDLPPQDILYNYRIEIHLFGDTDPWFSGEILSRPKSGSTKLPYVYQGYGYFGQLATCKVNQQYNATTFPLAADRDVGAVADHVMTTFIEPETDIVYDSALIDSPSFEVTDIIFERVSAKVTMERLAEIAQNYQFGVDENRKFFFKEISTAVNAAAIRFVGKDMSMFSPKEENIDNVKNEIDIVSGKITSGSNYISTVSDATSQGVYGKRWGKLTIPEALDSADAARWGAYQLSRLKDPAESAVCDGVIFRNTAKVKAEGKARIIDADGIKHELYIRKVVYNISSSKMMMTWHLGEIYLPLENEIVALMRNLKNQEVLQQSNVAQLV